MTELKCYYCGARNEIPHAPDCPLYTPNTVANSDGQYQSQMTTPTDTELNEFLAIKGMGWKYYSLCYDDNEVPLTDIYKDEHGNNLMASELWHPCSSLDQMFIVEERIIELGLGTEYAAQIMDIIIDATDGVDGWLYCIHATSRQKALAAYKVFEEVEK